MQTSNFVQQRDQLINSELRLEGIRDEAVLQAMRSVPREEFLPENLREFAYRNVALPIEGGQTISQPYIVALMIEALELKPDQNVLEIGTGSGYAAAVLSKIAKQVVSIERVEELARIATVRLKRLGYKNVHVLQKDGTRGCSEFAPFDAIVVAAGGPSVPRILIDQLKIGGRLVMPVGSGQDSQMLIRMTRSAEGKVLREDLGAVRFVPLIGEAGWQEESTNEGKKQAGSERRQPSTIGESPANVIRDHCESFSSINAVNLDGLLDRIGDARIVLIGEASHGSSEFYRIRNEITKALIERRHFDFVSVEADWPDAYRIHDFVTHKERDEPYEWEAFARFPTWMWRNQEVLDFIHWLRDFNFHQRKDQRKAGFYGLDLYSMFTSIHCVLNYLERVDAQSAEIARVRYGCLTPWEGDPALYGRAALSGRYRSCESEVVKMLKDVTQRRLQQGIKDGEDLFDAQLNARLIADAEQYYRIMYYGSDDSWNHRDTHMFQTFQLLLDRYGRKSRGIVWAHNSHLGNATATQFGEHGQINLGQLCREAFTADVYAIGQGTNTGTVAAASSWEGPMEIKDVRPAHPESYERMMHLAEMEAFFLPLKQSVNPKVFSSLAPPRLERAIGVIYRPETELQSHYFRASLPHQFDEWIWFDQTSAIHPLTTKQTAEHEPVHPFATFDE